MNVKSFLAIIYIFSEMYKITDFLFEMPFTTKKQKITFKYKDLSFSKEYSQKTFFPVYAKTSKMINNNRYGNHSNLECKLKRREKKWK